MSYSQADKAPYYCENHSEDNSCDRKDKQDLKQTVYKESNHKGLYSIHNGKVVDNEPCNKSCKKSLNSNHFSVYHIQAFLPSLPPGWELLDKLSKSDSK